VKKYKDAYDFAEKVINNISFVKDLNIQVKVTPRVISFTGRKNDGFHGGGEITSSLMDHLEGIVNGLVYGYKQLKINRRNKNV